MGVLSITFRIPEGAKITDDRLDQLEDLGVDPADVSSEARGEMCIRFSAEGLVDGGGLFAAGEEFAEEIEGAFDDVTLLDMEAIEQ